MAKGAKKTKKAKVAWPAMAENGQKAKDRGRDWPKKQRPWPKLAKKRKAMAEGGQPWPKKPKSQIAETYVAKKHSQPWPKMAKKTKAMAENGQKDKSHGREATILHKSRK